MSSGRPAAVDVAMTAIPLETGWRRDQWLVADGPDKPAAAGAFTSSIPGRRVSVAV